MKTKISIKIIKGKITERDTRIIHIMEMDINNKTKILVSGITIRIKLSTTASKMIFMDILKTKITVNKLSIPNHLNSKQIMTKVNNFRALITFIFNQTLMQTVFTHDKFITQTNKTINLIHSIKIIMVNMVKLQMVNIFLFKINLALSKINWM